MKILENMRKDGSYQALPKKEVHRLEREHEKLEKLLAGIRGMNELPSMVFVVDIHKERIAVDEARKLGIPLVALVDTNSNPDLVQLPIPGNDDATRSIKLITSLVASAVLEGRQTVESEEDKVDSE